MVKSRHIRRGFFCFAVFLILSLMGNADREFFAEDKEAGESNSNVMHGPQIPPGGEAYDEWKGLEYTTETEFDLKTFWGLRLYDSSEAEKEGYILVPEVGEGRLVITGAEVEPVGGEMKLRSGGYVDITVTIYWTATFQYMYRKYKTDKVRYVCHDSPRLLPFDRYTGICLLNYSSEEESTEGISEGEAVDSGFTESNITWKDRTYRLFAREDLRNAGGGEWEQNEQDNMIVVTAPTATETVYTFRVPADYDGLALCIDRDISDEKPLRLDVRGEWLASKDYYADILTDDWGGLHEKDEFYFIKIADLLKHFEK